MAQDLKPDIVLMDISMPGLNGVDATRLVVEQCPGTRVLALSMHQDRRYVDEVLLAGASGYIVKEAAFSELAAALRAVQEGRVFLSPSIAGAMAQAYVRKLAEERRVEPILSVREREVLQLVAEGLTTREIAQRLFLSPKTIDTHRQQTMRKLGIDSVAELTKYAIREGITRLDE